MSTVESVIFNQTIADLDYTFLVFGPRSDTPDDPRGCIEVTPPDGDAFLLRPDRVVIRHGSSAIYLEATNCLTHPRVSMHGFEDSHADPFDVGALWAAWLVITNQVRAGLLKRPGLRPSDIWGWSRAQFIQKYTDKKATWRRGKYTQDQFARDIGESLATMKRYRRLQRPPIPWPPTAM